MKINPLTQIDFYKADHRRQYPEGTELVYSNFTPRSLKYAPTVPGLDSKVVFFGLQAFMQDFLIDTFNWEFFKKPLNEVVRRYKRRMDNSLGKDSIPVDHVIALHKLGYLPISIRALPEGECVPERVPVMVIENTKPEFFWLTNYLETILSNTLWKPCTSATTARKYRVLLERYCKETGGDPGFVQFQAHDFSFRGMSGSQDAMLSGAAHLLSFVGTDTVAAIDLLEDLYGADSDVELVGCSVPATEHSVMCMGGCDGELETFDRLISEVYPSGIVSVVSDTWDFWQVVTSFLPKLKSKIIGRNGKLVIRPDSGDPVKIIVGDEDAPEGSPERKGAIQCLWETFGGTTTEKGYKLLDAHIGLIYGDSITLDRCWRILEGLKAKEFASTNVVLGIGSYTYQHVTRDTLGFAVKSTYGVVKGKGVEIYKKPKTDNGMKNSARGMIAVCKDPQGEYELLDQVTREVYENCELKEVFRDGVIKRRHTLSEIRERVSSSIQ